MLPLHQSTCQSCASTYPHSSTRPWGTWTVLLMEATHSLPKVGNPPFFCWELQIQFFWRCWPSFPLLYTNLPRVSTEGHSLQHHTQKNRDAMLTPLYKTPSAPQLHLEILSMNITDSFTWTGLVDYSSHWEQAWLNAEDVTIAFTPVV